MPHPQAAACASVGIIYISRVCRYHAFFTPRILCFSVFFKATNVTAERGAASCFSLSHRDTDSERVVTSPLRSTHLFAHFGDRRLHLTRPRAHCHISLMLTATLIFPSKAAPSPRLTPATAP